jgi:hypothetical protein
MKVEFRDLANLAEERYRGGFAAAGDNSFSLTVDDLRLEFFSLAGDPVFAFVRVKVLDLADVQRPGDFAKNALAGNFFWGATRGATLYVGSDNALYACERRPIDELFDGDGLAQCVDDFGETVADWLERSALYA